MVLKNKIVGHVKSTVPMMSGILITLKKLGKVMEELRNFSVYGYWISISVKAHSA